VSIKDQAKDFARLFDGLGRSSGRYVVPDGAKADAHGKILGRAWTSKIPVTLALWEDHLSGKKVDVRDEKTNEPLHGSIGMGIVPIRDDATAVFAAIDIDVYPLDLTALVARVRALKLPLVPVRSKSGGCHLYAFFTVPTPAPLIRERLMEWAVALNHPGVEVFPKQASLTQHSEGDWINIPYAGGSRSVRYALKDDGSAMTVDEFIKAADAAAITPLELEAFEVVAPEEQGEAAEDWLGAPPCLRTLARTGFGDWGNNGLYNIGVYRKMAGSGNLEADLSEYNRKYLNGQVGPRDVAAVAKSVGKKNYFYKCKDQPIVAVCNRAVCLKCEHGVGSGAGDPGVVFGEMSRVETDPITWIWSIDGYEIELSTPDLSEQRRFKLAVMEKLSKVFRPMKPEEWDKLIGEKMASAKTIKVPEDGTKEGQFWAHLANFCTGRARAKAMDEILRGQAYTDKDAGRAYFRSTDFFAYLTTHRFQVAEREGWRFLRHRGAEHSNKNLKGKVVNVWSVPAFPEQTEEHAVPRGAQQVEM
jgi:hypothetical protein